MEVPGGAGFPPGTGPRGLFRPSYPGKRRECGYGSKRLAPGKYFVTIRNHRPQASPGHRGERSFGRTGGGARPWFGSSSLRSTQETLIKAASWLSSLDLPVRLIVVPEGALQGFNDESSSTKSPSTRRTSTSTGRRTRTPNTVARSSTGRSSSCTSAASGGARIRPRATTTMEHRRGDSNNDGASSWLGKRGSWLAGRLASNSRTQLNQVTQATLEPRCGPGRWSFEPAVAARSSAVSAGGGWGVWPQLPM